MDTFVSTRALSARFSALGIDKSLSAQLAECISRWRSESGPEWTVKRLKLIKTNFIRSLALEQNDWCGVAVKAHPTYGYVPKGPFGVLWKIAISHKSTVRVLNAMMVYSAFVAEAVTPKQWEKFHKSATRQPPTDSGVQEVMKFVTVPKWMKVHVGSTPPSFEEFCVSKGYTPSYTVRMVESFIDSDIGQALWEKYPIYQSMFKTSLGDRIRIRFAFDDYFGYHDPLVPAQCDNPVGTLGMTQEPGYKLRVFAAPNIVHQCAMSRMKRQVFALLRSVKWDCTYNQSYGIDWCKEQLALGKVMHSIDLSDATNNFPLSLQIKILREIGCHEEDINLFTDLSRAAWKPLHDKNVGNVRWTVGQPLGLGPSFAVFALTHGLLVRACEKMVGVTDSFRVLGDDIVISHPEVASKYLQNLTKLDIPISKDKTITSKSAAEFAGKVITRDGILATTKWKEGSDDSFVDVVKHVGVDLIPRLPPRQRKVCELLLPIPEPEGFGRNPNGIPLHKRVALLLALQSRKPVRRVLFRDPSKHWDACDRLWKHDYLRPSLKGIFSLSDDIAQASVKMARRPVATSLPPSVVIQMGAARLAVDEALVTVAVRQTLTSHGYVAASDPSSEPFKFNRLEDLEKALSYAYEHYNQYT